MLATSYTRDQHNQFQRLFGRNLRDFWDNITGFDIIAFDKHVAKPHDGRRESIKDALLRRYSKTGKEAVELIMDLIDHPMKGQTCPSPK